MESEKTLLVQTKMEEASHDPTNIKKKVVFESPLVREVISDSYYDLSEVLSEVTENSSCFNVVESSPKIGPFCCSSPVSPNTAIDPDPCDPPYDPKINFLSPRPRFLYYKPNPRIEFFLNKEKRGDDCGEEGMNGLEDSLNLSRSSSETDVTEEEETQSGDSVKESSDGSTDKESSDDLSDTASQEQQTKAPIKTPVSDQGVEAKKVSKTRFLTPSKAVSFLFVLFLVACSPPMDLPIYKDLSFSNLYHESSKFSSLAKESLDGFVKSLRQWSANLVSHLSHLKSHFSSREFEIRSIQFFNLTTVPPSQEELLFDGYMGANFLDTKKSEPIQDFDCGETEEEMEDETETVEVEEGEDLVVDDGNNQEQAGDVDTNEEVEEIQTDDPIQSGDKSLEIQTDDPIQSVDESLEIQTDDPIQSGDGSLETGIENGSIEMPHIPVSPSEVKSEEIDSPVADLNVEASSETMSQSEPLDSLPTRSISKQNMLSVSLILFSASMAALVITHKTKRKSAAKKKMDLVAEPLAMTKKQILDQEGREKDMDAMEESCPSETSGSYSSKRRGANEVQSRPQKPNKKNKRESLASSASDFSMGCPSYGSFYTCERVPIKRGEDEMLTPIRRSSRLCKFFRIKRGEDEMLTPIRRSSRLMKAVSNSVSDKSRPWMCVGSSF